jgi:hypothetical protein
LHLFSPKVVEPTCDLTAVVLVVRVGVRGFCVIVDINWGIGVRGFGENVEQSRFLRDLNVMKETEGQPSCGFLLIKKIKAL